MYDPNMPPWEPGNRFALRVQEIRKARTLRPLRASEARGEQVVYCILHPTYTGKDLPKVVCSNCLKVLMHNEL